MLSLTLFSFLFLILISIYIQKHSDAKSEIFCFMNVPIQLETLTIEEQCNFVYQKGNCLLLLTFSFRLCPMKVHPKPEFALDLLSRTSQFGFAGRAVIASMTKSPLLYT